MAWYLSEIIGDGTDAEGNEFRAALSAILPTSGIRVDGRVDETRRAGICLAFTPDDTVVKDARVKLLPQTKTERDSIGLPDFGDASEDAAAISVGRRMLLRQTLRTADFPNMESKVSDLPDLHRAKLIRRLRNSRQKIDISKKSSLMTFREIMADILPLIPMDFGPKTPSKSGTFTDDFSGEVSNVDLVSHTPSGGTAWDRVDGVDTDAVIDSTNHWLQCSTGSGNGALYRCDDEGSADNYIQYVTKNLFMNAFVVSRATAFGDFIGVRTASNVAQIYKRQSGSFTQQGTNSSTVSGDDVIKMEITDTDTSVLYVNGVEDTGPGAVSTFNNTVTRQGIVSRSTNGGSWADDFEAGVLAAPAVGGPPNLTLLGVG